MGYIQKKKKGHLYKFCFILGERGWKEIKQKAYQSVGRSRDRNGIFIACCKMHLFVEQNLDTFFFFFFLFLIIIIIIIISFFLPSPSSCFHQKRKNKFSFSSVVGIGGLCCIFFVSIIAICTPFYSTIPRSIFHGMIGWSFLDQNYSNYPTRLPRDDLPN